MSIEIPGSVCLVGRLTIRGGVVASVVACSPSIFFSMTEASLSVLCEWDVMLWVVSVCSVGSSAGSKGGIDDRLRSSW